MLHRSFGVDGRRTALALHAFGQANLNALKWRARADGRVTLWKRARINAAQARHNALVARYRHN